MMKYSIYFLVLLMVAAVGCLNENPVATDTGNSSPELIPEAPKMVPFHAHEENTITVVPPFVCVPPDFPGSCSPLNTVLHAEFPGVIEGDHIGSGTIFSTSEIDFGQGVPFIQTGRGVITAANGDELNWDFAGVAFPTGPDDVIFNGNFTFEGGTGRFANATGGGTYTGSANTAGPGAGQFDLDGVISR